MTDEPVNWLVCSQGDLSDDDWRKLRLFIAAELEKDRAPESPAGAQGGDA